MTHILCKTSDIEDRGSKSFEVKIDGKTRFIFVVQKNGQFFAYYNKCPHTGASLEIERGRALKDVSEDLGHASMATTDTVYVQTSARKRAASGRDRKV